MKLLKDDTPYKYHVAYSGNSIAGAVYGTVTLSLTYPLEYAEDIRSMTSYIEKNYAVTSPIITFIYPLKDLKRPDEDNQ